MQPSVNKNKNNYMNQDPVRKNQQILNSMRKKTKKDSVLRGNKKTLHATLSQIMRGQQRRFKVGPVCAFCKKSNEKTEKAHHKLLKTMINEYINNPVKTIRRENGTLQTDENAFKAHMAFLHTRANAFGKQIPTFTPACKSCHTELNKPNKKFLKEMQQYMGNIVPGKRKRNFNSNQTNKPVEKVSELRFLEKLNMWNNKNNTYFDNNYVLPVERSMKSNVAKLLLNKEIKSFQSPKISPSLKLFLSWVFPDEMNKPIQYVQNDKRHPIVLQYMKMIK